MNIKCPGCSVVYENVPEERTGGVIECVGCHTNFTAEPVVGVQKKENVPRSVFSVEIGGMLETIFERTILGVLAVVGILLVIGGMLLVAGAVFSGVSAPERFSMWVYFGGWMFFGGVIFYWMFLIIKKLNQLIKK